jgi:hypothetical protein
MTVADAAVGVPATATPSQLLFSIFSQRKIFKMTLYYLKYASKTDF